MQTWLIVLIVIASLIVLFIAVFVFMNIFLFIFAWRNAKLSIKPRVLTLEREVENNKKRELWLDYDSYDKKDYEIKGKDGYVLHATFVDNEAVRGNGKYMILLHGHTSNRYGSVKYLNSYIKLGFSCLIYDARTHGENAPDKCSLGYLEAEDLMFVIEDTRKRYSDIKVLGLHGESMGSSTALIGVKYEPQIDFIVADCGFISAKQVIRDGYSRIHLQFLVPSVWVAARVFYGLNMSKTDAYHALENNKYPILFIHGAGDTFIKPYHSEKLREAASKNGAYTELVLVEGAGHAKSRYVAGFDKYTSYIENFLKNISIL
ncbi:MAG: lysophospholipase [Saccharofermentans sp.]|nr:lysophospholipase [Saccharofermentans sp.]